LNEKLKEKLERIKNILENIVAAREEALRNQGKRKNSKLW
jgi:hypothetical protein